MAIAVTQTAIGLACITFGCVSFWYLMPRRGKVHPLVERWDGGSMLTLVIMSVVTTGIVLVVSRLFE